MATPPDFTAGAVLTASQMNQIGMWKIKPSSVSSGSSIGSDGRVTVNTSASASLNGIFTADFLNYRVIVKTTAFSSTPNFLCKLRASGSDSSTNYNYTAINTNTAGGSAVNAVAAGTSFNPDFTSNTLPRGHIIQDWCGPFEAAATTLSFNNFFHDTVNYQSRIGNGTHTTATSYDGLTFSCSSGTFSATIDVYGYN